MLVDSNTNSFSVWRRRYVRFLQSLPNAANDPVVIDELIIQADLSDDFTGLLRLLSDGKSFQRLVDNTRNSEVFALSLIMRIEAHSGGLFRYLVERWLNKLGVLQKGVMGDSTDRSERSQRSTSMSQLSENDDVLLNLPESAVCRSDFAWLVCDWLFAVTRTSPNDSDHQVTVNAFADLIPLVAEFCQHELAQGAYDAEAFARLGGFLMRCSARFSAPRFNNLTLALKTIKDAARLFAEADQHLSSKSRSDLQAMASAIDGIDGIDELSNFMEQRVDESPGQLQGFNRLLRYSYSEL